MSDDVVTFILSALGEMSFDVENAGPDSLFGPAGIDLDSIAVVELAVRIQDTYGVTFADEHLERLAVATVGEFAAEVAGRSAVPESEAARQ